MKRKSGLYLGLCDRCGCALYPPVRVVDVGRKPNHIVHAGPCPVKPVQPARRDP